MWGQATVLKKGTGRSRNGNNGLNAAQSKDCLPRLLDAELVTQDNLDALRDRLEKRIDEALFMGKTVRGRQINLFSTMCNVEHAHALDKTYC